MCILRRHRYSSYATNMSFGFQLDKRMGCVMVKAQSQYDGFLQNYGSYHKSAFFVVKIFSFFFKKQNFLHEIISC